MNDIQTLRQLKKSRLLHRRPIRDEIRANLIAKLKSGETLFPGIIGYDDTVVPQIVNALLARHDLILLGLRGQAKTRILRSLTSLLDEWTPVIPGCPLNSHPEQPISAHAKRLAHEHGDDLPVAWLHRDERYREKLATPDVTIADLIGDVDPIKAASRRLDLSDEEVLHFGIVPRTNRGIFGINELPDLPTRIQVGLLNILEEQDVQIRGFPVRMPIDVLLVFTANPEDYTNRGNIITPLRDRIESQIHTHYPLTLEHGMRITEQEAWIDRHGEARIRVPRYVHEVVEEAAVQARTSAFVDQNSGVSARMTIALLECIVSNAERRALACNTAETCVRPADLFGALPAVTGKIELVYEGEREGSQAVARAIVGKAVKAVFDRVMPDPYKEEDGAKVYEAIQAWFKAGHKVALSDLTCATALATELKRVPDLEMLARNFFTGEEGESRTAAMEFILEGLHQSSILSKEASAGGIAYADAFDAMVRHLRD